MRNSTNQKKDNHENDSLIRPIRTYQDDVANLVKNQKVSTSKIVLAEQKRKESRKKSGVVEKNTKKVGKTVKIIVSLILFLTGIVSIILAIQYNLVPQSVQNIVGNFGEEKQQIIPNENTIEILAGTKTNTEVRNEIVSKISSISNTEPNQIIEFEIKKNVVDQEGNTTKEKITSNEFIKIINANTSDKFNRSLNKNFLYGIYTDIEPIPFIILETNDIDLTFSETFTWENRMYNDLKNILNLKNEVANFIEVEIPISTTTKETGSASTSTPTTTTQIKENPEPGFDPNIFEDIVVSNRDGRAIVDEAGEIILIYSFINDETLLLTSKISVFQEIIKKVSTQNLLR